MRISPFPNNAPVQQDSSKRAAFPPVSETPSVSPEPPKEGGADIVSAPPLDLIDFLERCWESQWLLKKRWHSTYQVGETKFARRWEIS